MAQTLNRGPVSGTAVKPPSKKKPFLVDFYSTAVGKKYVMAITGIIGIGFVLAHMIGNLKMYLGRGRHRPLRRVPPRAARADLPPHRRAVDAAHRADRRGRSSTSTPRTR